MNLILSGPIDDALTNAVHGLVQPQRAVPMHARAIRFEGIDASPATRSSVASMCDLARVDHAFVDRAPGLQHYGLLAMDMDSTLITIECIDEIADFAGKKKEVAAITEATMRGEILDFAESLRMRVALLAGTDAGVLERVLKDRMRLSDGAEELLAAARAAKLRTILVSGGFTYFSDRLRLSLCFDVAKANQLEIVRGRLTGRLLGPVFGPGDKSGLVQDSLTQSELTRDQAIVIGDGSNDIPMMRLVAHSVSFHGKAVVTAAATHAIRYGTLRSVIDFFD